MHREAGRGGQKEQAAERQREEKEGTECGGRGLKPPAGGLLKPWRTEGKDKSRDQDKTLQRRLGKAA